MCVVIRPVFGRPQNSFTLHINKTNKYFPCSSSSRAAARCPHVSFNENTYERTHRTRLARKWCTIEIAPNDRCGRQRMRMRCVNHWQWIGGTQTKAPKVKLMESPMVLLRIWESIQMWILMHSSFRSGAPLTRLTQHTHKHKNFEHKVRVE